MKGTSTHDPLSFIIRPRFLQAKRRPDRAIIISCLWILGTKRKRSHYHHVLSWRYAMAGWPWSSTTELRARSLNFAAALQEGKVPSISLNSFKHLWRHLLGLATECVSDFQAFTLHRVQVVKWGEDVVDNEDLGRKKSKKCCIFHKVIGSATEWLVLQEIAIAPLSYDETVGVNSA